MNSSLILKILADPTIDNLRALIDGEEVSEEVTTISQFGEREVLDFTGTVGPPQFRSLMVSWRLASHDVVISFLIDCAFHVLPIALQHYSNTQVLGTLESHRNSSIAFFRTRLVELSQQIQQLYMQAEAEETVRRKAKFDQIGYVPLEWGQENGRASSAVCVLHMISVALENHNSPRFARNVDGLMCALVNVFPDFTDELGETLVAMLSCLVQKSQESSQ